MLRMYWPLIDKTDLIKFQIFVVLRRLKYVELNGNVRIKEKKKRFTNINNSKSLFLLFLRKFLHIHIYFLHCKKDQKQYFDRVDKDVHFISKCIYFYLLSVCIYVKLISKFIARYNNICPPIDLISQPIQRILQKAFYALN